MEIIECNLSYDKIVLMRILLLPLLVIMANSAHATEFDSCRSNRDCIVVFDKWCRLPVALNQKYFASWQARNLEYYKKAKKNRQTCEAYIDTDLYYSFCDAEKCSFDFLNQKKPEASHPVN